MEEESRFTTIREVAEALKMSVEFVRQLVHAGKLEAVRVPSARVRGGRRILIPLEAAHEFLEKRLQPISSTRKRRRKPSRL